MKKTLLPMLALALFLAVPGEARAEGDPIWSINPIPLFGGAFLCFGPVFNTDVVSTNNVIVGSCVDIFASNNSTVVGLNPANGATMWAKTLPFTAYNLGYGGKALTADSTGFYIGGGIPWSGAYREVIEKRSLVNGNLIWSKSGPNCFGAYCPGLYYNHLVLDGAGHLYTTQPNGGPGTSWSGTLSKLDASNGNKIWSANSLYAAGLGHLVVDNDGIYVGGSYISSGAVYAANQRAYLYQKFDPGSGASLWIKNGVTGDASGTSSLVLAGGDLYAGLTKWLPPGYTTGIVEVRKIDTSTGNTLGSYTDDGYTSVRQGDSGGFYFGHQQNFYGPVPPVYKKRNTGDMSPVWSVPVRPFGAVHRASDFYALTSTTMERRSLADGSLLWSKGIASDSYGLDYLTHDGTYLYGLFVDASWNFSYKKMNATPVFCGSANGIPVATAPAPSPALPPNNLCTSGTAPLITDAGASFTWTCDGLDGLDATPDDVACSAPKIATLSLCTAGGIPIASTPGPHSRSLFVGVTEQLHAYYDTTPNVCSDSAAITDATWTEIPGSAVVTIAGATASPQTVTAGVAGTERVTISRGLDMIALDYVVSLACNPTTTCGEQSEGYCRGQPFTIPDNGCGSPLSCTGSRFCDFNWKEVAPGD